MIAAIARLLTGKFYKLKEGGHAYLHAVMDMAPATEPGKTYGAHVTFLDSGASCLTDAHQFCDNIDGLDDPWWGANQMGREVQERMLAAHIANTASDNGTAE